MYKFKVRNEPGQVAISTVDTIIVTVDSVEVQIVREGANIKVYVNSPERSEIHTLGGIEAGHIINHDMSKLPHLIEDEIKLLMRGQKLEAIKAVRYRLGYGLKEAHSFVEQEWPKCKVRP